MFFHYIYDAVYHASPWLVGLVMAALLAAWAFLGAVFPNRMRLSGWILLAVTMVLTVHITLSSRSHVPVGRELMPFSMLFRSNGRHGLIRSMIMNIFFFIPHGAALPFLFPERTSLKKRLLLTIGLCCCLSVAVELAQYFMKLGIAQTDDVICNTLGAAIGACSYPLAQAIRKRMNRKKEEQLNS